MTHLDPALRSAPLIQTKTEQPVQRPRSDSTPTQVESQTGPRAVRMESPQGGPKIQTEPVQVQTGGPRAEITSPSTPPSGVTGQPSAHAEDAVPKAPVMDTSPSGPAKRSAPPSRPATTLAGARTTGTTGNTGTASPISAAFKKGELTPGHFNLKGTSEQAVSDACLRMNAVMSHTSGLANTLVERLQAEGGPLHGLKQTGQIDASKLDDIAVAAHTILRELQIDRFIKENKPDAVTTDHFRPIAEKEFPHAPLQSATALREAAEKAKINWQTGKDMGPYVGVTTSKNVKVTGWKEVSISEASLKQANEQLAAKGAFIRLVPSGPPKDGFVSVKPQLQSLAATSEHSKLSTINADRQSKTSGGPATEKSYVSWADCHRTAQTIMGSEDTTSGIRDQEHVRVGGVTVPPVLKAKMSAIAGATDHGANRAMHALFQKAMPEFAETLRQRTPQTEEMREAIRLIDAAIANRSAEARGKPLTEAPANFGRAYRYIFGSADEREKGKGPLAEDFAKQFGVNKHAAPQVGQAFAQINDEVEKDAALKESPPRDLWNFHFAGVVMVDADGSYLTLENLSTENPTAVNDDWYFRLYNPDRSFHTENYSDAHVGNYPLTMLFEYVPS